MSSDNYSRIPDSADGESITPETTLDIPAPDAASSLPPSVQDTNNDQQQQPFPQPQVLENPYQTPPMQQQPMGPPLQQPPPGQYGFYDPQVQMQPGFSPIANQQYQQQQPMSQYQAPAGSVPNYDVFDVLSVPNEFHDIPPIVNDNSPCLGYWETQESFSPNTLASHAQYCNQTIEWYFAIPYFVFLIVIIGLFINGCRIFGVVFADVTPPNYFMLGLCQFSAIIYLYILFAFFFIMTIHLSSPKSFTIAATFASLLCPIVASIHFIVYRGVFVYITIPVLFLILGLIWLYVNRRRSNFDGYLTSLSNKLLGKSNQIFTMMFGFALHGLTFILHFYALFGPLSFEEYSRFYYIYFMLSAYFLTIVHANVIHTMSAAFAFFEINQTQVPFFFILKRCVLNAFGAICKVSYVTSFSDPLRRIGLYDLETCRTEGLQTLSQIMTAIISGLQRTCQSIVNSLHHKNGYISKSGLVYIGVFGIKSDDACIRSAEVMFKRKTNVFLSQRSNDSAWLFFSQSVATVASLLIMQYCYQESSSFSEETDSYMIFSGFVWFTVWTFFYQVRSQLNGISHAVIAAFGEAPNKVQAYNENLYNKLKKVYHLYHVSSSSVGGAYSPIDQTGRTTMTTSII